MGNDKHIPKLGKSRQRRKGQGAPEHSVGCACGSGSRPARRRAWFGSDCLPWLPTFKTWGPPIKVWISGFSSKAGHAGSSIPPPGRSGRRVQGCFLERTEMSGLLSAVAHPHYLPGPWEPLSGQVQLSMCFPVTGQLDGKPHWR